MAKHSYEIILDPTVILDHEIPFIPDNKSIESTDSSNTTQENEDNMVCNRNNMPSFDQLLYFETKLLQILNDGNAPLYLYKKIIEWTLELCQSNVAVDQLLKTREAVIKQIESKIPFLKKTKSYQKEVLLSTDDTPQAVNVTVFDFKSQLLSLINHSSLFNDLDNLDVNPKNRFGKYKSENHIISSVNSGNRYELAYNTLINDPEKDFLMPIIFACDETKVSSQGKGSCWPLLFTTSILNQSSRNLPTAWKPLGYIYDTSLLLSQNEERKLRKPLKSLCLHQILDAILESFVKCQNDDSLHDIELCIAGKSKIMNIKIYCHVIIGDMQGGDKMCSTSACYSILMKRISRGCDASGENCGDPDIECKKIVSRRVEELVLTNQEEVLNNFNQYNVYNAWFKVNFGGCPYGIFSAACPIEPLHSLENGIIADCLKILFKKVGSTKKLAQLDQIAQKVVNLPRQKGSSSGSDKTMPRLLWKDGITVLTDLTASYKVGIMFTVVVISLRKEGLDFFIEVLGDVDIVNDMRECFQMILCYWMWLKKKKYWDRQNNEERIKAKEAIREMLRKIKSLWP